MSYTFETELFGLTVEVEGEFDEGQKETMVDPSIAPSFEVWTVMHKGWEMADLPDEVWEALEHAAFKDAHDKHDPY
jgi:hypothetical protein